jgi:hypothetical protein
MTAGPGGMAVQGQTVDANGMVRRVAYGNVPPQQQYVMANGGQVQPGAHRGQGQQVRDPYCSLCELLGGELKKIAALGRDCTYTRCLCVVVCHLVL